MSKKKEKMNFKSFDSLLPVSKIINESNKALKDKDMFIVNSSISDVLAGALGAGIGGGISFAALYGLGVSGLSAAGITSGLAVTGAIVGGGMSAGIFVLAAPIAVLGAAGVGIASHNRNKKLNQEKERLYKQALLKHEAIIKAKKEELNASKERMDLLEALNILLQQAINDLKKDLGIDGE